MNEYTESVTNGMRVKHTAKARFTVKSGSTRLEDRLVDADIIGGAVTLASIIYNRATRSGGSSWWNPTTGETIAKPKVMVRFRPEDILTGNQECDCEQCLTQK